MVNTVKFAVSTIRSFLSKQPNNDGICSFARWQRRLVPEQITDRFKATPPNFFGRGGHIDSNLFLNFAV